MIAPSTSEFCLPLTGEIKPFDTMYCDSASELKKGSYARRNAKWISHGGANQYIREASAFGWSKWSTLFSQQITEVPSDFREMTDLPSMFGTCLNSWTSQNRLFHLAQEGTRAKCRTIACQEVSRHPLGSLGSELQCSTVQPQVGTGSRDGSRASLTAPQSRQARGPLSRGIL
jgi:hypothetical protein